MGTEKILIANRGECAFRLLKTIKKIGLKAVCIYSDVDKNQPYIEESDEAYPIGGVKLQESYLNIEKIIELAKATNCVAIHPGYGLLSENYRFALACIENGIKFIGPSVETLKLSGDKLKAKEIVKSIGIEPVPGSFSQLELDNSMEIINNIGFPLVIKGAESGGGIGIAIANSYEELKDIIKKSKRRVTSAFGSDKLYIEKYLPQVKHVEVQILGDSYGNVATLGIRECSIQRRYQKLIEETPSVAAIKYNIYEKLQDVAKRIAKAINYTNAGTIEFLLTPEGKFYFLEINARLQVEHPVTEETTGIDLVEEQIKIAFGEKLSPHLINVNQKGHAIELRIYAEDPYQGFKPTPGKVDEFRYNEIPQIRIDHGLKPGIEITPYYDPLLAKVIAWDHCREKTIERLTSFLPSLKIAPITTNISFLNEIISSPLFKSGDYYTNTIELLLKRDER